MGTGTLRRYHNRPAPVVESPPNEGGTEIARTYSEADVQGLLADLERAELAAKTSKEEVAELQRQLEATRDEAARKVKHAEEVAAKQIADAEKAFGERLLTETETAVTRKLREIEDARIAGVDRAPTPNETVGDLAVERVAEGLPSAGPATDGKGAVIPYFGTEGELDFAKPTDAPKVEAESPSAPKPAPAKGKGGKATEATKK